MRFIINNCTVNLSSNSASENGRFALSGRVHPIGEHYNNTVHFSLTHSKSNIDYAIHFPDTAGKWVGNDSAMSIIRAIKVVEQLIHRYSDYLKLAMEEKGECGRIISLIEAKEYELAALFIDMVEIGEKDLTERERTVLEREGIHGCESVLDVLLHSDVFKPALTFYRDRWQSTAPEAIPEALEGLFDLASSVYKAHRMLAYIELMKLDTENTFTSVHDWKANRLHLLEPSIISQALAKSTEQFFSYAS